MKKTILFVNFFVCLTSFGQNTPRYSQINFAQGLNNPAAIAIDSRIMVDLIFRNQWMNIKGAPTTGAINAQYDLYHDMAVGLIASYDLIGVHHATHVTGQYAYRLFFQNRNAFIFGVSAGIDQKVHDLASAQVLDADDHVFSTTYSRLFFNAGFGVHFFSPNYYFGTSIPQLFQNTLLETDHPGRPLHWHHYTTAGFYWHAGSNYTLNPHLQIKTVINAPIQADIILRNTFMNAWSLVVGYRTLTAIIAGFDFRIGPSFRMGYSFNYDVGRLATVKKPSNELYVGIGLPYHNSREGFKQIHYINRKGKFRRDLKHGYKRRPWYN